jgi:hypothetical protein
VTNTSGTTFVNVLFGTPQVRECRCCEIYSFEESNTSKRLVAFVATRHARTADEAVTVAQRLWATASAEALPLDAVALTQQYATQTFIRKSNSRAHLVELVVSPATASDGYVVSVHVGDIIEPGIVLP